jgi:hypothetical protein
MTTLADLRTSVASDLRDPDMRTFTQVHVGDLINAGMEEVSRVYPLEKIVTITPQDAVYDYDLSDDNIIQVFRVEYLREDAFYAGLTESDHDGDMNGWEVFAGELHFPRAWFDNSINVDTDEFRVWGYATRARLTADDQVAELDETGEWAVRAFSKFTAFSMLHHDRALYKQWQAQSQNTDVTVNQLGQMVALYTSEWDRQRSHLRRLRRV